MSGRVPRRREQLGEVPFDQLPVSGIGREKLIHALQALPGRLPVAARILDLEKPPVDRRTAIGTLQRLPVAVFGGGNVAEPQIVIPRRLPRERRIRLDCVVFTQQPGDRREIRGPLLILRRHRAGIGEQPVEFELGVDPAEIEPQRRQRRQHRKRRPAEPRRRSRRSLPAFRRDQRRNQSGSRDRHRRRNLQVDLHHRM